MGWCASRKLALLPAHIVSMMAIYLAGVAQQVRPTERGLTDMNSRTRTFQFFLLLRDGSLAGTAAENTKNSGRLPRDTLRSAVRSPSILSLLSPPPFASVYPLSRAAWLAWFICCWKISNGKHLFDLERAENQRLRKARESRQILKCCNRVRACVCLF